MPGRYLGTYLGIYILYMHASRGKSPILIPPLLFVDIRHSFLGLNRPFIPTHSREDDQDLYCWAAATVQHKRLIVKAER